MLSYADEYPKEITKVFNIISQPHQIAVQR